MLSFKSYNLCSYFNIFFTNLQLDNARVAASKTSPMMEVVNYVSAQNIIDILFTRNESFENFTQKLS